MKAQVSVEFLLLFLLDIALVSTIALSMLAQKSGVEGKMAEAALASKAEGSARAAEVAIRCGLEMEKSMESRIEESLHARAGDRLIEVEGIFRYDGREPV